MGNASAAHVSAAARRWACGALRGRTASALALPLATILLGACASGHLETRSARDPRDLGHDSIAREPEAYARSRLAALTAEAIRFPTVAGNLEARKGFQAWLEKTARGLGLETRNAGKITEIELPGPKGAPVLGLVVHGDVQPVEPTAWTVPPFEGLVQGGFVIGRGAADDKGPLVQALLAMSMLETEARTQTIRLLVGSTEESDPAEMGEYLKDHEAPAYSLVLDSGFPVVVGEKAWQALTVTAPKDSSGIELSAGLAPSIVPDIARVSWPSGTLPMQSPTGTQPRAADEGTRAALEGGALVVRGKSAHAGVNIEGGRNALVSLARLVDSALPPSGARDLLAFARLAGTDIYGSGLGLTADDPLWGRFAVNVATVKDSVMTINLRRPPPMTGPQLREHLFRVVADFNARTGAELVPGGFFDDEPLVFDPESRIVRRLMADYERATGMHEKPAISGGGTYAKRLPHAIAFGMWFPGKPYPGHDVDEKVPLADRARGLDVLLVTLRDLAEREPLQDPFGR